MKRFCLGIAALTVMSACGGGNNVFGLDGETGTVTTPPVDPNAITVPASIAGEVLSATFDPNAQTLSLTAVRLDNTPFEATYTRKAALDIPGYLAFTNQDSPITRHNTAFAAELDGVYAAVTASGQFTTFLAGATYGRTGTYSAPDASGPDRGIVSYYGRYAGVLNYPGDQGDLLPVPPGTPVGIPPVQLAEVTGLVLVNADFADNAVEGFITDRVVDLNGSATPVGDLAMTPTAIATNGTFEGEVELSTLQNVGSYAGVFGGVDASAVAGGLAISNHITTTSGSSVSLQNTEESGIFVLPSCNSANADPLCP